ncbi:uncharacterized protein LOC127795938 [Diospyros lotus]|uniref:uncharacterized protein LOC127795938 n=1 Tax=Diospyros lotus TaxID=55363 RepID=UPI002256166B|nr:uncharacterized protein LOC127795938 [Diospyros lotus]
MMEYWPLKLGFAACLIAAAAIHGAQADATVTGNVFCDQCKDGQISHFDYPLYGIKVGVKCEDSNGQVTLWREEATNWFGSYAIRIEGSPDLSGCYAQVSGSGQASKSCVAMAGPPRQLKLTFRLFDTNLYSVDPLLSQPAQPMSFCPKSAAPAPPAPVRPPAIKPSPIPPTPFLHPSACPYWSWTMREHKCYWKVVAPDTKVAVVYGLVAARRYGTDMTLWKAMQGRGDPYRTLLREATTALLNSYSSFQFPYHPLVVIQDLNWALIGSTRRVLHTALRFKRANSGYGKVGCKFTPCKS